MDNKIDKTEKTVNCKGCGLYIEWITTKRGANMPVDPLPVTVVTKSGYTVQGYIPHWATCKRADKFRKNKRKI